MGKMQNFYLYTDGGARGNPGPAGIGFIIKKEGKTLEVGKEFIGKATNNEAEYKALIKGLREAQKYKPRKLVCFLDSKLVVSQLRGLYKIKKAHLAKLAFEVKKLEQKFPFIEYRFINRSQNHPADKLVNEAINEALKTKS